MRARSAEPRSTLVSVGQVSSASRVVHADDRDVAGHVEARVAQRGERADREQVVRAEDRVGPRRARAGARSRARPGSTVKSSATSISASSRSSPHERRPSR